MRYEFGNYHEMYGLTDYTDATVLDIGADYGSTAKWFLKRGAKHVIASERMTARYEQLKEWAKDKPVTVCGPVAEGNVTALIANAGADIVKVDCEGCESLFLSVPDVVFSQPRTWIVETHTDALYHAFIDKLERNSYRVQTVQDWGPLPNKSGKTCRVIQGDR